MTHGDTHARFIVRSWKLKEKLVNSLKGGSQGKDMREVSPPYLQCCNELFTLPLRPGLSECGSTLWMIALEIPPPPGSLYHLPSTNLSQLNLHGDSSLPPILSHREILPNVMQLSLRLNFIS